MRANLIRQVFSKEIISTMRDRRALLSGLLIPFLLLPTMMIALPLFMGFLFAREGDSLSRIAVLGREHLPLALVALIEAEKTIGQKPAQIPVQEEVRGTERSSAQVGAIGDVVAPLHLTQNVGRQIEDSQNPCRNRNDPHYQQRSLGPI